MKDPIKLDGDKTVIFDRDYVSIVDRFNEICLTREQLEAILELFPKDSCTTSENESNTLYEPRSSIRTSYQDDQKERRAAQAEVSGSSRP